MPELPEVEEVRRTLAPVLVGVQVTGVTVARRDFVTPVGAPVRKLIGRKFISTFRHGKKLFCVCDDDQTLMIHLGMSGRVDCVPSGDPKAFHTHVTLSLASGIDVRLRDPRRFGGVWYYRSFAAAKEKELAGLGPDALGLKVGDLEHWKKSRGGLKQRLLSQRDVAGLGNIYVDESLWAARLHPLQRVERISPAQVKRLVEAVHEILRRALLAGGTTLRDYRNVSDQPGRFARELLAYGRGGEPCRRCRKALKVSTVAGRTTVSCGICQRRR